MARSHLKKNLTHIIEMEQQQTPSKDLSGSQTLNEPVKEKKKRGRKPKPKPTPEERFKVYHGSFIVDFSK
jgi:hypothetical protein